jgi:hypothetical protein
MSSVVSMPKAEEILTVAESSVQEAKPLRLEECESSSTTASDPASAQDSKSTTCTSDDGKSQPEDSMENLYILRFTRCPREFRDALLDGPLLQDCQESMKSIGLQAEMTTGSKIFCKPGLHKNALEAVAAAFPNVQDSLRPYHVIVTEEFQPIVLKIVNGLPRGLKVKCKEESVIARISDTQWVSVECNCLDRLPRKPQKEEALVECPLPLSLEAAAAADAQPSKTKKSTKAKGAAKAPQGRDLEVGPLFDDLFPSFPVMPMDPMALSFMNTMYPGMVPEPDWSSTYLFRQALEEQQAMLTRAIACNLHAQRVMEVQQDGHLDCGIPLDRL